jgi:hypothetical protein
MFKVMIDKAYDDFGNGRDARNLFEGAIKNLASRVAKGDTNIVEIKAEDIPDVSRRPPQPDPNAPKLRVIKPPGM